MPVLALGVSYRRAPVDLLERLAVTREDEPKTYRRVLELPSVSEAVLLSTCNRVEVYAEVDRYHQGFQDLKRFLAEDREVPPEDFADPLYSHYEDQAAEHLFAVAAGLDSMVVGEPQILAQVRSAIRTARREHAAGPALESLFTQAVRVGKRVRVETPIGASPSAFVEAGAGLAERFLGGLRGRRVVVVGAGEMSALALDAVRTRGVGDLVVLGRREERARRVADPRGARSAGLEALGEALASADLVVSSTGAAAAIVDRAAVEAAVEGGRRLFLLDLAVPRDVDPSARDVPGVAVADIDDLRPLVANVDPGAEDELAHARRIVRDETARYAARRREARLAPLIEALHSRGERVRETELRRLEARLSRMSDADRETVEAVARGVVRKLLHDPVVRLKELSATGSADAHARALAELFGLDVVED